MKYDISNGLPAVIMQLARLRSLIPGLAPQLFVDNNQPPNRAFDGCALLGIDLSGGRHLSNLGMAFLESTSGVRANAAVR